MTSGREGARGKGETMKNVKTTINTYDTETGTTIKETSVDLFEYHELSDDARARVIDDLISEHEYWLDEDFRNYESEIWDCVCSLEKNLSYLGIKWNYNPWYSCDFDIVYRYSDYSSPNELYPINDDGVCYSMDLCDVWNAHISKLNAICYHIDYVSELMDKYPMHDMYYNTISENVEFNSNLDELHLMLIDRWYIELCDACKDVANTLQGLLQCEWDYCHSREYTETLANDEVYTGGISYTIDKTGRKYFSDTRKWFTSLGELFEESNVMRECVSIVKAS